MKKIKRCRICGNKKFKFLFAGKDKNIGIKGKFNIFECEKCKVIFLNPLPSTKESEKFYPKSYYSFNKIDKTSKKTKLKILLYKIYFNNGNFFLRFVFSPLKFFVRGTFIKKGDKLLDIGAGSGQFLYEMQLLGLKTYGTEPGNFDEKFSKKQRLNIKKGFLENIKYPSNFFDIITINHVLEHLNNPIKTIKEIKRILKKKGKLIVGVPNTNSLAYKLFKKNWIGLQIPTHPFNFSDNLLIKILKNNGFKVLKKRYNSRPSQFVVSLRYLFNFKKRNFPERILNILFLIPNYLTNLFKIGDQVEVFCEKI
jgi:SAM-dependent methyltransferase